MKLEALGTPAAIAALLIGTLGLAACGESSEEKASKQVCSGVSEIRTQIKKLETLPISANFPAEAKTSVEAIKTSIGKIRESAPKLESARKEEIEAANQDFQTEIATIFSAVISSTQSSNLEGALRTAGPKIKAALSKLSSEYQKAFEALKC